MHIAKLSLQAWCIFSITLSCYFVPRFDKTTFLSKGRWHALVFR